MSSYSERCTEDVEEPTGLDFTIWFSSMMVLLLGMGVWAGWFIENYFTIDGFGIDPKTDPETPPVREILYGLVDLINTVLTPFAEALAPAADMPYWPGFFYIAFIVLGFIVVFGAFSFYIGKIGSRIKLAFVRMHTDMKRKDEARDNDE